MFGCEISVAFLSGQTESVHGVRLMVTVMMPVDILENLARDAEESANFVHRDATLRLLCRNACGVTSLPSPAAFTTARKPLLIRLTDRDSHSIRRAAHPRAMESTGWPGMVPPIRSGRQ
jgi:hypothetical protein